MEVAFTPRGDREVVHTPAPGLGGVEMERREEQREDHPWSWESDCPMISKSSIPSSS